MLRVLLTNDDGIDAEGLQALRRALVALDDIELAVIAPDGNRSATARSITFRRPLWVAEVGAVVDAGDDDVGLEAVDQTQRGHAHAVHRRAVAGEAVRAVAERHLGDPQRAAEGDRPGRGRAVAVGRDHGQLHVLERHQRAPQRLQPFGVDAVVVGEEHAEHGTAQDIPGRSGASGA